MNCLVNIGFLCLNIPPVVQAPNPVYQALQQCHMADIISTEANSSVRVWGGRTLHVPGSVLKFIPATCSDRVRVGSVMFETHVTGAAWRSFGLSSLGQSGPGHCLFTCGQCR